MTRVLCDFHHTSLLRSLHLLFEDRLGWELYRPIGMEWYEQGYWAINDLPDTAKQFLDLDQAWKPEDGTPPLNTIAAGNDAEGIYMVMDPGGHSAHKAATLDFFINNKFDYVIASIPAHVPLFKDLIAKYQPWAKLIVQMGNNWPLGLFQGENVLASVAPQSYPQDTNAFFYHQEFDTKIFKQSPTRPTKKIYSYVNIIQNTGIGWEDYKQLQRLLPEFDFKAYGGQCPDGNKTGPMELAKSMSEAQFIFHVKPGGDGYGHVIHNAYATGRPIITRPSHYKGQLAEQLLVPGTFIDLDRYGPGEIKNIITRLTHDERGLKQMGARAAERFKEVVNFGKEAADIKAWLTSL